jgi:hypothetical protein
MYGGKIMNKDDFITAWTSGRFTSTRKEVIVFIADILYHNGMNTDAIYNLFACGYCYYFAVMLKDAFKRGEVCWHKGFSHIVWLDDNNVAYDIGGVFDDYDDGDLVPASELGDELTSFKKTPFL